MKIEFLKHLNKKDILFMADQLVERLSEIEQKERDAYNKKYFGKTDKELGSEDSIRRRRSFTGLSNCVFSLVNGTTHLRNSIKYSDDV